MKYTNIIFILFCTVWCHGQNIKGVVTDTNNVPLAFANVYLESEKTGTTTDDQGRFSLTNISAGEYLLVVRYMGYMDFQRRVELHNSDVNVKIRLSPDINHIKEATVVSDRYARESREESMVSLNIKKEFLLDNSEGSLMQTLAKLPGVNSINVGPSVSKPIIRGMSFNRVAVVNNGLKLEGQQWGETHGLEIDQFTIDNVKVIKGPASLAFGSDAVAGVIEILPSYLPSPYTTKGEVQMMGKSNNKFVGTTAGINSRKDNFFYNARVTYLNFGDFAVPKDSIEYNTYNLKLNGSVKNTAGNECGFHLQTGYVLSNGYTSFELSNFYRKTGFYADAYGVELRTQMPVDHDASDRDALIPYQEVNHIRISNNTEYRFTKSKIITNVGYQNNVHNDYDHLTDITGKTQVFPKDHKSTALMLHTLSANATYKITLNDIDLSLGNNNQYIMNKRGGFNFNIPDYHQFVSGIFVHSRVNLSRNYFFNSGVRYDYGFKQVEEYINPRNQGIADSVLSTSFYKNYHSLTGMMGISARWKNVHAKINVGKSFRIPSIRETSAFGMIWSAARFEEGNVDLDPEEAYQLDLMLDMKWSDVKIMTAGFYSYFTNYIFPNPTGEFNAISGAGQVYNYLETRAIRIGGEFSFDYYLNKLLECNVNGEYVYAVNLKNNGPLPFTPPFSVDGSIKIRPFDKRSNSFMAGCKYIANQDRVVQNEVPGYYTPSAYVTYLAFNFTVGKKLYAPKVTIRVDNLFNTEYYNHLSIYRRLNIPEPGRNIHLNLNIPLEKSKTNNQ